MNFINLFKILYHGVPSELKLLLYKSANLTPP